MTKKELTTIRKKIEQYKTWAEEEAIKYKNTKEEDHFTQFLLNDQAANALENLLLDLNY